MTFEKIIEEAEYYKPGWKESIFQDATQLYQRQVQLAAKTEKDAEEKKQKLVKQISEEEKRKQIEEELLREEEEEKKKQPKRKGSGS